MTLGPRSYGTSKKGRHIVIRFYVTKQIKYPPRLQGGRWWVVDMETANIARGTEKLGYESRTEAVEVAREYRDEYGAWAKTPF